MSVTVDHGAPRVAGNAARRPPVQPAPAELPPPPTARRRATAGDPQIAHMVHELRTPIHSVLGYTTLLNDGLGGALPPRAAEMIGRIANSAEQLRELVDDFLELVRLRSGKVQVVMADVSLPTLLRDTAAVLEPQAQARGIELVVRAPDTLDIRTDAKRVRQIVLNLATNAVKFTGRGGKVTIAVESCDRGVAVQVVDTGIGIAAEDHERLFGEFVQLGVANGGTGLGLAISRQLARLLGGDITLRSEPGLGSCFTLTLPPAAVDGMASGAVEPSTPVAPAATFGVPTPGHAADAGSHRNQADS